MPFQQSRVGTRCPRVFSFQAACIRVGINAHPTRTIQHEPELVHTHNTLGYNTDQKTKNYLYNSSAKTMNYHLTKKQIAEK